MLSRNLMSNIVYVICQFESRDKPNIGSEAEITISRKGLARMIAAVPLTHVCLSKILKLILYDKRKLTKKVIALR